MRPTNFIARPTTTQKRRSAKVGRAAAHPEADGLTRPVLKGGQNGCREVGRLTGRRVEASASRARTVARLQDAVKVCGQQVAANLATATTVTGLLSCSVRSIYSEEHHLNLRNGTTWGIRPIRTAVGRFADYHRDYAE